MHRAWVQLNRLGRLLWILLKGSQTVESIEAGTDQPWWDNSLEESKEGSIFIFGDVIFDLFNHFLKKFDMFIRSDIINECRFKQSFKKV